MRKFEYTVLDVPTKGFLNTNIDRETLTETLNELGKKGWEVVSLTDTEMYQGTKRMLIVILKREIIH